MAASWTIGRIRGVPLRLHASLLLALPYFGLIAAVDFVQAAQRVGIRPTELALRPWMGGLIVAVGLFACVALHEFSHALVAIRLGGKVRSITLHLLGGVSSIERLPPGAWGEGLMSAAGPLASLVLAALAFVGYRALPASAPDLRLICYVLAEINLALAIFNLIPAFPLDGGRLLRSILLAKLGRPRATRIAAGIGRGLALALGILGLLAVSPILVLIAAFIFFAAGAEARAEEELARPGHGVRVGEVMLPPPRPVDPDLALDEIERRMQEEHQAAFPVVEEGRVVGVVGLMRLLEVPKPERERLNARAIMASPLPLVTPRMLLYVAERMMEQLRVELLPVTEAGQWVGVVTRSLVAVSPYERPVVAPGRAAPTAQPSPQPD